ICEICGLRSAVYVCRECGRFVCPNCQSGPMCKDCQSRSATGPRSTRGGRTFPLLPTLAVMAVLAGVSLVILALRRAARRLDHLALVFFGRFRPLSPAVPVHPPARVWRFPLWSLSC